MKKRIIMGITGASGAPLAVELLRKIRTIPDAESHVICSRSGALTLRQECGMELEELRRLSHVWYDNGDIGAAVASGSFRTLGMAVVPCSMKTLAGIVTGYSDSLLLRAADVVLKERRRLVLVPRECPLSTLHLRNLTAASELGAVIVPPCTGLLSASQVHRRYQWENLRQGAGAVRAGYRGNPRMGRS